MIALCPKCQHELEEDGCPDCGWGKPIIVPSEPKQPKEDPVWITLDGEVEKHYRKLIENLSICRFNVGSPDKRFVRDVASKLKDNPLVLSERQMWYLDDLQYRYRRQLKNK